MRDIEEKTEALVRTFREKRLNDHEIRDEIVKFIKDLVGFNGPTAKLSIQDIDKIRDYAIGSYRDLQPNRRVNGQKLSSEQTSTVMWLHGVVYVLREKGLLPRPVEADFEKDVVIESVFED
jgi:hypothetical protein